MQRARPAQGTIIATLIMVGASALFTTIMLFWSLSLQGQTLTNYSQALFRSNSQASEQISIDEVLFDSTNNRVKIFVRNFGDVPIRVKAVYVRNITGTPLPDLTSPLLTCELKNTLVVVARSVGVVTITNSAASTDCKTANSLMSVTKWKRGTVVVQAATDAGTSFDDIFRVPE